MNKGIILSAFLFGAVPALILWANTPPAQGGNSQAIQSKIKEPRPIGMGSGPSNTNNGPRGYNTNPKKNKNGPRGYNTNPKGKNSGNQAGMLSAGSDLERPKFEPVTSGSWNPHNNPPKPKNGPVTGHNWNPHNNPDN